MICDQENPSVSIVNVDEQRSNVTATRDDNRD